MLFCTISIGAAKEPFDSSAGLSAYVNVGSGINIDTAVDAFNYAEGISGSDAWGVINIMNADGTSDPIHVYVDTNGWIAAYLARDQNVGLLVQYADMDYTTPAVHTTLEDAISKMCEQLNISYATVEDEIEFYDFEHPTATNMTVALNVIADDVTAEEMYVLIPGTHTVYESNIGGYNPDTSNQVLIGVENWWWAFWLSPHQRYCGDVTLSLDTTHEIIINSYGALGTKATSAFILVYG